MSSMAEFAEKMAKFKSVDEAEQFLDVGYAPMNKILGGNYSSGLTYGRIVEIYGPPASGKTVIATLAMTQAQRQGGMAVFVDWECAFSEVFAQEIGLNVDFPMFHKITPTTFEEGIDQAFEFVEQIRKEKPIPDSAPIVMVFDSIAAAVPKSKMYDKDGKFKVAGENNMNDNLALAKATSSHLPRVAQFARRFNAVVILLNQLREKPGVTMGGDNTYTPGGKTPEFVATTRIQVSSKKIMEEVPGGKEFKGRLITFKTTKNKATRPFQGVELRLVYEDGCAKFDFTLGLIEHLTDTGKLEVKGARVSWIDGKTYFKTVLARKIDDEGLTAELTKLLYAEKELLAA